MRDYPKLLPCQLWTIVEPETETEDVLVIVAQYLKKEDYLQEKASLHYQQKNHQYDVFPHIKKAH